MKRKQCYRKQADARPGWWPGLVVVVARWSRSTDVTLRRARLILGRVNHHGITSHQGQLSLSSFRGR